MILGVTGHRPDKLGNEYDYIGPYSTFIRNEIKKHLTLELPNSAISGMAVGVDTIFAEEVLKLKIKLIAAIPFKGQEKCWPKKAQDKYWEILNNPLVATVIVCDGGYAAWKMQKRNEFLVDASNKLIAVWNGTKGGTRNTINFAKSVNKTIIYINPEDWKPPESKTKSLW